MRMLEVRRHSMRKSGGGSQLSQEGVEYARRLGTTIGPFARVVTSVVPRARETAIAMGFAVDYEIVTLASDEDMYAESEATRWWEGAQPFVSLASVVSLMGPTWRYAHALAAVWRDVMLSLPDGGSALVIGHSGEIETALVACFPQGEHAEWGATLGPCEGARLQFSGGRFVTVEFLRNQPN